MIQLPRREYRPAVKPLSTQMGFGQILNDIAREDTELARRIVTTSPDVTVSTNLGGWVNRRGLFARESMADTFKAERIPSTFTWEFGPKGQHLELGIAELNLFILLSALGLSHTINGERLLPIGTLYDPFIYRAADEMNYACYQDARFLLVATPSGITLAPEGGAHQSIGTPLIGLAQDGLAPSSQLSWTSWPPCCASHSTTCNAMRRRSRQRRPGCATRRADRSICGSRRAQWSRSRPR